eukprot:jgi/Mesvir1/6128/Mv00832-RA.1
MGVTQWSETADIPMEFDDLFADQDDILREKQRALEREQAQLDAAMVARRELRAILACPISAFCKEVLRIVTDVRASHEAQSSLDVLAKLPDLLAERGYRVCECTSGAVAQASHAHPFLEIRERADYGSGLEETVIIEPQIKQLLDIARPSKEYAMLMDCLPEIFVGPSDTLYAVVEFMANRMAESLMQRGLSVPPWRTKRAVAALWFGYEAEPLESSSSRRERGGRGPHCSTTPSSKHSVPVHVTGARPRELGQVVSDAAEYKARWIASIQSMSGVSPVTPC